MVKKKKKVVYNTYIVHTIMAFLPVKTCCIAYNFFFSFINQTSFGAHGLSKA